MAVAAVAVAVAAVAVADADRSWLSISGKVMPCIDNTHCFGGFEMLPITARNKNIRLLQGLRILLAIPLVLSIIIGNAFAAAPKQKTPQQTFSAPEDASQALASAARENDIDKLLSILGPEGSKLIFSGDKVEDRAALDRFAGAYNEKNQVVMESQTKAVLEVGSDRWPLPIPIVKTAKGVWRFDTLKGKEEILNRRIGRDELSTIQVCMEFVEAQREYASKDRSGDGLFEYAQKFLSDPGKKNGLYWETKEGEEQSPLGPLIGQAKREGYKKDSNGVPIPYHGYFFRILSGQGKYAPRGAYNYVVNGRMVGGFAMVAYPAQYGSSGIMTFIVSHDGVVYEKNLGKKTPFIADSMTIFSPDETWRKVDRKALELSGS